jgi:hypothetical protein
MKSTKIKIDCLLMISKKELNKYRLLSGSFANVLLPPAPGLHGMAP